MTIEICLSDKNQHRVYQGEDVEFRANYGDGPNNWFHKNRWEQYEHIWTAFRGSHRIKLEPKDAAKPWRVIFLTKGVDPGRYTIRLELKNRSNGNIDGAHEEADLFEVLPPVQNSGVAFGRTAVPEDGELILSQAIREATEDISFNHYQDFINEILCPERHAGHVSDDARKLVAATGARRGTPFSGIDAYQTLKVGTEIFLLLHTRVLDDANFFDAQDVERYNARHDRRQTVQGLKSLWTNYLEKVNGKGLPTKTLPYLALIRRKLGDQSIVAHNPQAQDLVHVCDGIQQAKLARPCFLELIWSYWHEEGMLVQSLNAIALRFQNQRASARDPLATLDIDPLRPLSNFLWGYVQDEQHRLTVARRAYEYDHHYGMSLHGKAVPPLRSADSRSKFLEAFHNLLTACVTFYKQDDNKMIIGDAFPVLNALKEVHQLLAEGAHNQYGDLPTTARIEMLMQQWLLARPEMREFLSGRTMVPYLEPWMERVDAMKKLQNWTDVSVGTFNDLARFGEQLLLSIRFGHWSEVHQSDVATNWAREWRSEVKQYIHAYRAATGVDLAPESSGPPIVDRDLPPSVHLRRRLETQQGQRPAADPARNGTSAGSTSSTRSRTSPARKLEIHEEN
jgi:hypothetical protein